jgi:dienelactone hydrolase
MRRTMKDCIGIILVSLFISFLPVSAHTQQDSDMNELIAHAQKFVELLATGEFFKAVENFDDVMTKAMPEEKLKQVWQTVLKQAGQFKKQAGVRTEILPKYESVYITCQFEKGPLDVKVVFNREKKITGLWFVPTQKEYTPPDYVELNSFKEKDVVIGQDDWTLPGTLTIPDTKSPFPAVVLVHGSGPNDRDESIGPNKPFRDLAWGLASQKIAVLRYEKRTKVHSQKLMNFKGKFTVKEETVDDALAAVGLLRGIEGIDEQKIFVLGHSLGGMLAPRIGMQDSKIAGLIIMAGTTRPIEEVMLEQVNYIISIDGKVTDDEKTRLEEIERAIERVKQLKESGSYSNREYLLGAPPEYWLDLSSYNPPQTAREYQQPMLMLQGGRDYQVTEKDFGGWKKALSSRKDVEFKLYPALNHLFIEGTGESTPAEYSQAGHVAKYVIDDIATWIKNKI